MFWFRSEWLWNTLVHRTLRHFFRVKTQRITLETWIGPPERCFVVPERCFVLFLSVYACTCSAISLTRNLVRNRIQYTFVHHIILRCECLTRPEYATRSNLAMCPRACKIAFDCCCRLLLYVVNPTYCSSSTNPAFGSVNAQVSLLLFRPTGFDRSERKGTKMNRQPGPRNA